MKSYVTCQCLKFFKHEILLIANTTCKSSLVYESSHKEEAFPYYKECMVHLAMGWSDSAGVNWGYSVGWLKMRTKQDR